MNQEEFYQECARIVGAEHSYEDKRPQFPLRFDWRTESYYRPMTNAGRRSGREPGNGRYPGIGLVRDFGETIHVTLSRPIMVSKSFADYEAALAFLRETFN